MTGGKLRDQRILFLGAGSAGIGIADLIASAMTLEGLTRSGGPRRISLFDVNGLLEPSRTDLFDFQKPYAHPHAPSRDFVAVHRVDQADRPHRGQHQGQGIHPAGDRGDGRLNQRPIIFALSNPTEHAECTAEEALTLVRRARPVRGGRAVPAGPRRRARR